MLEIPSLGGIKKIYWKDIEPGLVILAGINVNNGLPLELRNFPSLTVSLIFELNQKYHFRSQKEIIVAYPAKGESSLKVSKAIQELENRLKRFHKFRFEYLQKKLAIQEKLKIPPSEEYEFIASKYVDSQSLRKGRLNSIRSRSGKLPSFLSQLRTIVSPKDVLGGNLSQKLYLPEDKNIQFFLGIGYASNFKSELLPYFTEILDYFYNHITNLFTGIKFHLFGVSEVCEKIKYPIGGRELLNTDISYSAFFKKCLHNKNKEIPNKAFLLTTLSPVDLSQAMETGEKLKKNGIDLTIVFYTPELTEDDRKKILHVSEAANSNLFVIHSLDLLLPMTMEALNHYLGSLTVSMKPIVLPDFPEFLTTAINKKEEPILEEKPKEKVIKPFEFKKIKRIE
jgi:hypothetical protein